MPRSQSPQQARYRGQNCLPQGHVLTVLFLHYPVTMPCCVSLGKSVSSLSLNVFLCMGLA